MWFESSFKWFACHDISGSRWFYDLSFQDWFGDIIAKQSQPKVSKLKARKQVFAELGAIAKLNW